MNVIERVKLFYVSLAWSGIQFQKFAEDQGISRGFLHDVLWNKKVSARIRKAIDDFIRIQTGELRNHLN